MIEALLCDMDGTLVQSNWLHAEAWQVALGAMGVHLDLEDLRRQIGKGGDELIPVFVPWWKREAVEEPLKAFRKFVFQHGLREKVTPLPGVRGLFEHLHKEHIKIALATSSGKADLQILKRIAGIEDLVDVETCADDTERSKPHPDIFTVALEKLSLKPSQCLALGDTPYDAESAGKAGIRTVGVTSGGWTRGELMEAGCIAVYENAEDLLTHIEESPLLRTGLQVPSHG